MNIAQVQNFIYNRIKNAQYFNDITVLNTSNGVTENDVLTSLSTFLPSGGKSGLCIIILPAIKQFKNPNIPTPTYDVNFIVRVMEDPKVNTDPTYGCNKDVQEVSMEVDKILHQTRILNNLLVADSSEPSIFEDGKIMIDSTFKVSSSKIPVDAKVAAPTITKGDLNLITITCTTSGASIYYSIDESYPTILYTTPFTSTTDVIAIATKTDMRSSDIQQLII
jgi:hypothetical protein